MTRPRSTRNRSADCADRQCGALRYDGEAVRDTASDARRASRSPPLHLVRDSLITSNAVRKPAGFECEPRGSSSRHAPSRRLRSPRRDQPPATSAHDRGPFDAGQPGNTEIDRDRFGILLALAIAGMAVSLIRSESANDLRTLTATGAAGRTRRALTATTAGTLAALAALLGTGGAYIALIAAYHADLGQPHPYGASTPPAGHRPAGHCDGRRRALGGRQPASFTRQRLD